MTQKTDRLYQLLPPARRRGDYDQGEILRALLGVIDEQLRAIEGDVARLYDDAFIETCQEWVVPYLADLVGLTEIDWIDPEGYSMRALVANAIATRRAKGTAAALEQVARDASGWSCRVIESWRHVAATQHPDNPRPSLLRTPDLRASSRLADHGTGLDALPRTADLRRPKGSTQRAPDRVQVLLWRLEAEPCPRSPASWVEPQSDPPEAPPHYAFHPLGLSVPLYHRGAPKPSLQTLSDRQHLPMAIGRRALHDDLEAHRAEGGWPRSVFFGAKPAFRVWLDGEEVKPEEMMIADLSLAPLLDGWAGQLSPPERLIAVDPIQGRLVVADDTAGETAVEVRCFCGSAGAIGGGGYDRRAWMSAPEDRPVFTVSGGRDGETDPLADAVLAWAAAAPTDAIIEIRDSRIYALPEVDLPAGAALEIRAANGERPILLAANSSFATVNDGARLLLCGVLVAWEDSYPAPRQINLMLGEAAAFELVQATIRPGLTLNVTPKPDAQAFTVHLERAVTGAVLIPTLDGSANPLPQARFIARDSIVDGTFEPPPGLPLAATAGCVELNACTILGDLNALQVGEISNSLLLGATQITRRQTGVVRYSYVHTSQMLPQQWKTVSNGGQNPARPTFTSLTWGQPGYCQLDARTPSAIGRGASDEGEMGAFHFQQNAQRLGNLEAVVSQYLPPGLRADVVFMS